MGKRKHNLTGRKFGNLLALKETDPYIWASSGTKSRQWECLCACLKFVTVRQTNLLNGKTSSCGCVKRRSAIYDNK